MTAMDIQPTSEPAVLKVAQRSPTELDIMQQWTKQMLQSNRISECQREKLRHIVPHFSVPTKEKSGLPRIVGNFTALNEVTPKLQPQFTVDPLSIAKVSAKYAYRGKIDLSKAFFQMPITDNAKQWCGIQVRDIHGRERYFHYNVLPMGARNSPIHFQDTLHHFLDQTLNPQNRKYVQHLQDDIIVNGSTLEHCQTIYDDVVKCLEHKGFQINYEKSCRPTAEPVNVLGYSVKLGQISFKSETLEKSINRINKFLAELAPTKRARAQLLGQLQFLARVQTQLRMQLDSLYPEMNLLSDWDATAPVSENERAVYQQILAELQQNSMATVPDFPSNIYSDASKAYSGVWHNGKTYSFQPTTKRSTALGLELQVVFDALPKLTITENTLWHLDNEAAVQLLNGSVVTKHDAIRDFIETIRKRLPAAYQIKFIYCRGKDNKADGASRPLTDANTANHQATYKSDRQDRRRQLQQQLYQQ